jgi:hypothetical protein
MGSTLMPIRLRGILPLLLLYSCCIAEQAAPAADLIIRNAKIWTVDSSKPTAEAVAVLGERIVSVGSNRDIEE